MKTNTPIHIGGRRELLLDDFLVARLGGGAQLRLHQPAPREAVLETDRPWEGNHSGGITVFRDLDRFRLYYNAYSYSSHSRLCCLVESKDGIHWRRPALRQFPFQGRRDNNIVQVGSAPLHKDGFISPFLDRNPEATPAARYKSVGLSNDPIPALYATVSPDALHWSLLSEKPLITTGDFDTHNIVFWDMARGEYRAYVRQYRDACRGIRTATSPDFVNWTEPEWLEYPGMPDEQLYENNVQPYYRAPHLFVGFPARYVEREWSPSIEALPELEHRRWRAGINESGHGYRVGTAVSDGVFMSSRDGRVFRRWGEAFFRPGLRAEGNWVYGDNFPAWGMLETDSDLPGGGKELSLYTGEGYWRGQSTTIRRHTLRLDGFVSLNAPLAGGELVTRPLTFTGTRLSLNISGSAAGGARVEIQDADGRPIPGFALKDCWDILGDTLDYTVRWKQGADVRALAGRPIRLRFALKDVDLYAFQFAPETRCPVQVYVAGSPGHYSAKDHVFHGGETIAKQIACVWDGAGKRALRAAWKVACNGKPAGAGAADVTLRGWNVKRLPFSFRAPQTDTRSACAVDVTLTDAKTKVEVGHDRFAFQVYGACRVPAAVRRLSIALLDPDGGSAAMFKRLGIGCTAIRDIGASKGHGLLAVGRNGLQALAGTAFPDALPAGMPVLVLDQRARDLACIGFRAFPARTRQVLLPPYPHPVLRDIAAEDFCDWRVAPRRLLGDVDLPCLADDQPVVVHGTLASEVIETPTCGNFTPLLHYGFECMLTPLLETDAGGRRVIFSQLSLTDGVGVDPVATRLLMNILAYLAQSRPAVRKPVAVLGDARDGALAKELGISVTKPSRSAAALPRQGVALVGKLPGNLAALKQWVQQGGSAVVLPQDPAVYSKLVAALTVRAGKADSAPVPDLTDSRTFAGLVPEDFRCQYPLPVLVFKGQGPLAEMRDGRGRWVLVGFDTRTIAIARLADHARSKAVIWSFDPPKPDIENEPALRFTYRHQCRVLAQIVANLGGDLEDPVRGVFGKMARPALDLGDSARSSVRIIEKGEGLEGWTQVDFDDGSWIPFDAVATPYGHAYVRIKFRLDRAPSDAGLVVDLGTIADYDETWLNGRKIGSVNPGNSKPETAFQVRRVYPIPRGLLRKGTNVLAVYGWNRNAESRGWKANFGGPYHIRPAAKDKHMPPYAGKYHLKERP